MMSNLIPSCVFRQFQTFAFTLEDSLLVPRRYFLDDRLSISGCRFSPKDAIFPAKKRTRRGVCKRVRPSESLYAPHVLDLVVIVASKLRIRLRGKMDVQELFELFIRYIHLDCRNLVIRYARYAKKKNKW